MRIVHIVLGKANPNRMNGVNNVVNALATEQCKQGLQAEVWGITSTTEVDYDPVYKLRLFPVGFKRLRISSKLKKAIKDSGDTVFHIHGGFVLDFYLISKLLKRSGKPFIFTPHGTYMTGAMKKSKYFVKRLYFSLIERRLLKNASLIHFLGEGEASGSHIQWLKDKRVIVPNGCSMSALAYFQPVFSGKELTVGFCGRLSAYHKGLDITLKGFANYLQKGGKGKLHLIGDGEDAQALKQIVADERMEDAVIFHGKRFGEEKEEILKSLDVFVHTSRHEGMPVAVLEAAHLGIPAIISEYTNLSYYYRTFGAGYVLAENSPTEFSKTLKQAEDDKVKGLLKGKSAASLDISKNYFSWEKVAKRFHEIYSSVAT